jgi:hypothetical protein
MQKLLSVTNLTPFKLALVFVLIGLLSCQQKNNSANQNNQSEALKTEENIAQPTHDDKDDAAFSVFEKQTLDGYKERGYTILSFRRDYHGWGRNTDKVYLDVKNNNTGETEQLESYIKYYPSTKTWEIVKSPI